MFYDEFVVEKVTQGIQKMKLDALVSVRPTLCEELESVGLRVPEDIGVAVLDRPSGDEDGLSGICQNAEAIGSAASDLLVGLVRRGEKGIPAFPGQQLCGGLWIEGRTTRRVGKPPDKSALFSSKLTLSGSQ